MRIGILGGGQLGRMLALASYPLGIRTTVLDPSEHPCAAQVAPHIRGEFDDLQALYQLARVSDVITYEFENVPVESTRWLAERVPLYPPPNALEVSQDRLSEKLFFQSLGIPTAPFVAIETRDDLDLAIERIGFPAVLKTRRFGYDGKGQMVLRIRSDVERSWEVLGGRPLILEGFIPFDRELSTIAARGLNSKIVNYPLVENVHQDGILHRSIAPARSTIEELSERASEYATMVLQNLNYVGVLAIEWFQDGAQLVANEMAPRVHNSGHWSIEGANISQFELHIRAITGLPIGQLQANGNSTMFNFIGRLPKANDVLLNPVAHFHNYSKGERPGRKVGHVTLRSENLAELEDNLESWDRTFARPSQAFQ